MKKKTILFFVFFIFLSTKLIAQNESYVVYVDSVVSSEINNLESLFLRVNDSLFTRLFELDSALKSMHNETEQKLERFNTVFKAELELRDSTFQEAFDKIYQRQMAADSLISKVTSDFTRNLDGLEHRTKQEFSLVENILNRTRLIWIFSITIVAIITILLFEIVRRRNLKNNYSMLEKLKETRTLLEEEALKVDEKLVNILESQLQLLKEGLKSGNNVIDHSLALKVADEIIRIQKNIVNMDPGTKGLKQVSASVKRIKDNFAANGYEIVDMLNMPYDIGMKVSANFIPDDTLGDGIQIITRIIKPQVNYNGVMIQSAEIEVSSGS
jgi:hypothetical protein